MAEADTPSSKKSASISRAPSSPAGWTPPQPEDLQKLMPSYEILGLLGRGGMGAVYKGRQLSLDRLVAIKVLPSGMDDLEMNYVERFSNEARLMARLNHPGIVKIIEFGATSEGQLFIVLEFIEGSDLAGLLEQRPVLPPQEALAIAAHMCDALGYAHSHGVVHRDIKPANVMLDREGKVKVADFGLAKAATAEMGGLTLTSMVMGTPDYIAPETYLGMHMADHRADLYAVGVMLYRMITGSVPRGSFLKPSHKIRGLDPRLDGLIETAMEEDREKRFQSASEMRAAIDVALREPVSVMHAPSELVRARKVALKPTPKPAASPQVVPPHSLSWTTLFLLLLTGASVVLWWNMKNNKVATQAPAVAAVQPSTADAVPLPASSPPVAAPPRATTPPAALASRSTSPQPAPAFGITPTVVAPTPPPAASAASNARPAVGVAAPVTVQEKEPSGVLARYTFDFSPEAGTQIRNAIQRDGILELNGEFEARQPPGYRVVLDCPQLDYSRFTVAVRLRPERTDDVLIVGGTGYRWLMVRRERAGGLLFTMNNQRFSQRFPEVSVPQGEWLTLVVSCDLAAHQVRIYLNGRAAATVKLPDDFALTVIGTIAEQRDKNWTFTNYSNGSTTLKGQVDEVVVFDRILGSAEVAALRLGKDATSRDPSIPHSWTDSQGREVIASFGGVESGNVLLVIGGRRVPFAFEKLSLKSQQDAREFHATMQAKKKPR